MKWTGERLETFVLNETMIEHLHRYAIVLDLIKGKKVLDIASGEGYGSNLMADVAQHVTAVDIDQQSIHAANKKYKKNNLYFSVGSVENIPCTDNEFDYVISFETIEHISAHKKMLSEISRVLKPNGILIISTPDKKKYSDETGYNNPFHVKELYEKDFISLLEKYFSDIELYYQNLHYGSGIYPKNKKEILTQQYSGNYFSINKQESLSGKYIIALASNEPIPKGNLLGASFFDGKKYILDTFNKNAEKNIRYKIGTIILSPYLLLKRIFS